MSLIPKEIEAYYLQNRESERLSNEWGELERLRTQAILARNLPSAPAVIFDVGAQQENRIGYAGGNVQMASVALGD